LYLFHEAIARLPSDKRNALLKLVKQAFFDLSSAEAEEATFRGNVDLLGRDYFELMKRKTAVSEATAKIGVILGNGTAKEVQTLGELGYILGLLNTLFAKEILPLPVLNVFQDPETKAQIVQLLKKGKLTKKKTERIVGIVMEAKENEELKKEMHFLIKKGLRSVSRLKGAPPMLRLLLDSAVEDLQ
jgi:geranylgeranyl pyrophosphate synthase